MDDLYQRNRRNLRASQKCDLKGAEVSVFLQDGQDSCRQSEAGGFQSS